MTDIQRQTYDAIHQASEVVRVAGLGSRLSDALVALAGPDGARLEEPCTLAVVGRVKAGKSTFVNAVLGVREDLAKVGTTETTATINYFRYGRPKDPGRPVTVHYRGGRQEAVDLAFLNRLQGNDESVLALADGIERLEYRAELEFLRDVTLVDTPGTGAVVQEHQARTDEYLRLEQDLRARHEQETQRLGDNADAVVFLIGQVAKADDKKILEAFQQATGGQSRAFNAVGVLARVDMDPELLKQRHVLAGRAAGKLKDSLNTVVPVSAGLERAIDTLSADGDAGFLRLRQALRSIPPAQMSMLLDSPEFFRDFDFDDCPVDRAERRALQGDMGWMVFVTIARYLTGPDQTLASAKAALRDMAGFVPLRDILDRHIFRRSHILRCFRVLSDALALVKRTRETALPRLRDKAREHAERQHRFLAFLGRVDDGSSTVKELMDWVRLIAVTPPESVEAALDKAERILGRRFHTLQEDNADFEALHSLEQAADVFAPDERDELRALFGHHGLERGKRLPAGKDGDLLYVVERQRRWHAESLRVRDAIRRAVTERAATRLGLIADDLEDGEQT